MTIDALTEEQYSIEAARTIPEPFGHLDCIPTGGFRDALHAVSEAGRRMDFFKKALVYGRPVPSELCSKYINVDLTAKVPIEVLHGIIGTITEACELADLLLTTIFGDDDFDEINLKEELGDLKWYEDRICRRMGWKHGDIRAGNIAKLFVRHKLKVGETTVGFDVSQHDHANRDIAAERAALAAPTAEPAPTPTGIPGPVSFKDRMTKALGFAVNYHSFDADMGVPDYTLASYLYAYMDADLATTLEGRAATNGDLERSLEVALGKVDPDGNIRVRPPYAAARRLWPQIEQHLAGESGPQVYERMTPEERAKIGTE